MRSAHLLFLATLVACTEPADTDDEPFDGVLTEAGLYRVVAEAMPDPPLAGEARLRLLVTDPAAGEAPVLEAGVTVTPWMTSMDHGVMGEVSVSEIGLGEYEATWSYPMSGWWDVTVEIDGEAGHDQLVLGFDVQ